MKRTKSAYSSSTGVPMPSSPESCTSRARRKWCTEVAPWMSASQSLVCERVRTITRSALRCDSLKSFACVSAAIRSPSISCALS